MKRLHWCGLLLLCAMTKTAAQERQVTGVVYEMNDAGEKKELPGALVQTPDHQYGAQTLADGSFRLTVPETATQLVFSFSGYDNDTVNIPVPEAPLQVVLRRSRQLGEVVVTGHQQSTRIGMLDPVQTHHIGERELLKAACCNLSESFETTPSIDASFTDAVTGYRQIQMLGLTGPYTLITRENIPDARGLAAITGLTFTPGTWVESMQLSKGTGSVVNGYESVAGQLNVELRKPFEEEDPRWLLNAYQSTQGRSEGNLVYRHELGKYLSTNLMLHGKSQWMKVDQNHDGFLDQPMGKQLVGLNRWFFFGPHGLEFQAGVKGVYVDNTGGQRGYRQGTEQVRGNPWGFGTGISRVEGWAKIGKTWTDKQWRSMGLQLSGVYHDQDAVYGSRRYDAVQHSFYGNLIYQTIIGNTNHVIKGGASFLADRLGESFAGSSYARAERVPGVFTEYSWKYLDKWNIVAGIRADYHNLFGAFVTPRLHLRYAPADGTVIRASAGRAQRTANLLAENMGYMASNRSFVIVAPAAGKPYGLDPEVAWNMGINLTQKFRLNYRDGSFATDYYYTYFRNQVVVDIENPHAVRFYNLAGQSYAHSFQVQLDYEPVRKWDVRIAYRWYDVKTTYGGILKERPLVAAHRAFFNTGYALKHGWSVDYTVQWISPRRVPATYDAASGIMPEYRSPAFVQMNAQLTRKWPNSLEVYLGGENLTNYMQRNVILGRSDPFGAGFDASLVWGPAMGRNIYAGVRYRIK